jgi:adenine phosphoribosyltransferase
MDLKQLIRDYPDFPKEGIMFRDISPVVQEPAALNYITDTFSSRFPVDEVDMVAGIEARGLAFAALLATKYNKGFFMVRKQGKLPGETVAVSYGLEYGQDVMEIQADALKPGQKVLIVDDLLATGGTAKAAAQLIEKVGASVTGMAFVIELSELGGREALKPYKVETLVTY